MCGAPIEVRSEVFPEYALFAYDAVTTVAMGIQAVLKERSNVSFTTLLIAGLDIIGMTIEMIINSPSPLSEPLSLWSAY